MSLTDKPDRKPLLKRFSTYCPRLWKEAFITEFGQVYACCHRLPLRLGSLYQNTLTEIYNGTVSQRMRSISLKGRLWCYPFCNLLRSEEFENPQSEIIAPYNTLKRLKVQVGQDCNINCIMCFQTKNKYGAPQLDFKLFTGQVDLTPFKVIDIQGGEPLYIKSGRDLFDYSVSLGKQVSFVTNGTILNQEWAKKIVKHSQYYHVSLNAATKRTHEIVNRGSVWEKVLENILLVREIKALENSETLIKGHFTIIDQNRHELAAFIAGFQSLGLDCIDFGYDPRFRFALTFKPQLVRKLRREISAAIKDAGGGARIDLTGLNHLGLVESL